MQSVVSHRDVSRDMHEVGYEIHISRARGASKKLLITKIVSFFLRHA